MSLRLEFVTMALQADSNVRELCRRFGISPKTGYKWLTRYRAGGMPALADRSRRPLHSPRQTPATTEAALLALRQRHPAWGGRKLRQRLLMLGHSSLPAPSTITEILRRHNRLGGPKEPQGPWQRFERDQPNQLWQMDFKGHFGLVRGGRCHPWTVLDDHSRYALGLQACGDQREVTVRALLRSLFERYGLPEAILCDNAPPWGCSQGEQTTLGVWLLQLGVRVLHGRPYHPQTQGKEERFHRTLRAEVLAGEGWLDLPQVQRALDSWRSCYNHERPHAALALATPASRYKPSSRAYPGTLPPLEYLSDDVVRVVKSKGDICFRNRFIYVGRAFAGLPVAVRPATREGLWEVCFGRHHLGSIDLTINHDKPKGNYHPLISPAILAPSE